MIPGVASGSVSACSPPTIVTFRVVRPATANTQEIGMINRATMLNAALAAHNSTKGAALYATMTHVSVTRAKTENKPRNPFSPRRSIKACRIGKLASTKWPMTNAATADMRLPSVPIKVPAPQFHSADRRRQPYCAAGKRLSSGRRLLGRALWRRQRREPPKT